MIHLDSTTAAERRLPHLRQRALSSVVGLVQGTRRQPGIVAAGTLTVCRTIEDVAIVVSRTPAQDPVRVANLAPQLATGVAHRQLDLSYRALHRTTPHAH